MRKLNQPITSNKPVGFFPLVVMAASAGGISPLSEVLSALPADLAAAVVVVQHLQADRKTHLPAYLDRLCPLRVRLAETGMDIAPGTVYIAEPGKHLAIAASRLITDTHEKLNYVRPSADVLFASASEFFESRVIGVILSGTGRDGADGCIAIKAKGGAIIAQDKKTAKYFSMPQAAIATGVVNFVLPVEAIGAKVIELVKTFTV